ncbi:MAG TPA: putative molybdenum carrier protein [Chitinophagaceae bacterium]|nr:putative molybdenum carrier protein [Chitinophagaceae bacterium]
MLKIISGGQTGVDRAALDASLKVGIPCGGYCPKGRKSEDGVIPEKYPLIETKTDNYHERTELNVKNGDGTLILVLGKADRGTGLTIDLCKRHSKPCLIVDLFEKETQIDIDAWMKRNNINILNVAGNRESFSPGIHKAANEFLVKLLKA